MLDFLKKHSTKITLGAFLAFAIYQHTTDGLWFWCAFAYLIAKRLEATRNGEPFIRGEKRKQSILDFGLYNTITSFLLREKGENNDGPKRVFRRIFGVWFLCLVLMHMYIAVLIAMNYFLPDITNKYLNFTASRFIFLLDYWKGFCTTKQGLIAHGYAHRVPLVTHISLLVILVWVVSTAYLLIYCFKPDRLIAFYKKAQENIIKSHQSRIEATQYYSWKIIIINPITANRFIWCPAFLIIAALILLLFWAAPVYAAIYPGEELTYHQRRWLWLIGMDVYKNDMRLFYPSYLTYTYLMIVTLLFIMVTTQYLGDLQTMARKIFGKQISK